MFDLIPGMWVMLSLLAALASATALVYGFHKAAARGALQAQVVSWWWLLPPVFAAWALHPYGVHALVFLISVLAARELVALADATQRSRLRWSVVSTWSLQLAFWAMGLDAWMIGLLGVIAGLHFLHWRAEPQPRGASLLQALFAAQAAGLWCLCVLTPQAMPSHPSANWFLYLCVVTALNDIAQFLVGSNMGRHKLAPRLSPNKTWEGAAGGLLLSALISAAVGLALGLAPLPSLVAMGLLLSIAGLAGDLLFSAGKRALGIKDYSQLIPGHGGILDRVDSLVLTAPVLLLTLRWW
jgi:phosphatidate cytidylyltransferase